MSAGSPVLEDSRPLELPKVGTLLAQALDGYSARIATDFEIGGTWQGYDKHITIYRVDYHVDLRLVHADAVPVNSSWFKVVDPWHWDRMRDHSLRFQSWQRKGSPSGPARLWFLENVVGPFAEWLNTSDGAALLAGGAQRERDTLRKHAFKTIETLSAKQAELMLLLGKLDRCEHLNEEERTVLRSTRLEYR